VTTRIWEGKEFKCLGTVLTEDNYIATEIKKLIIMANQTSCGLNTEKAEVTEFETSE
jgi:hypothetical protein